MCKIKYHAFNECAKQSYHYWVSENTRYLILWYDHSIYVATNIQFENNVVTITGNSWKSSEAYAIVDNAVTYEELMAFNNNYIDKPETSILGGIHDKDMPGLKVILDGTDIDVARATGIFVANTVGHEDSDEGVPQSVLDMFFHVLISKDIDEIPWDVSSSEGKYTISQLSEIAHMLNGTSDMSDDDTVEEQQTNIKYPYTISLKIHEYSSTGMGFNTGLVQIKSYEYDALEVQVENGIIAIHLSPDHVKCIPLNMVKEFDVVRNK